MSYAIGQFRRDMLSVNNYLTPQTYSILPFTVQADSYLQISFTDFTVSLSGGNFQYEKNYYVKLGFKRTNYEQTIYISLRNDNNTNVQQLQTITIPPLDYSINKTVIVELVFSPNATYNEILLTLQRTTYDTTVSNEYHTNGRLIEIDEDETEINEFYNVLNAIGITTPLRKIGIQGPSGLLMCINGEGIRIGPSGIYEIKNEYKINSIGFVVKQSDETSDGRDYFILDYQY